ncbi:MAG TPA: glycosyltransferase family 4 protein [Thermomicrobiales bacterium]|nr:glycosyltransferase family 4 protein [Thermomicrobiales bacterium]
MVHAVYSLDGAGAVEARARAEIDAALTSGHEVVAVTDRLRGRPPAGARVWASVGHGLWRGLPAPGAELAAMCVIWRGLERALADAAPDVIVFHNSTLAWPALRAARAHGARSVFVVHALISDRLASGGSPYGAATTALYRAANRAALRGSDTVVCVSGHMARTARADGVPPERLKVAPNPVDTDFFRPVGDQRDIDVLFVGRLSQEKGVDVLLRALADLPRGHRAVVAGDGPLRGQLESQAKASGANVQFKGWVDRDGLRALYARSAVQVVPSRSEPQGVVVLEALASGTPVIGSDVGGIAEMVSDGENGWLVDPGRPDLLGASISAALADRERLEQMRGAARDSVARFARGSFPEVLADAYLAG